MIHIAIFFAFLLAVALWHGVAWRKGPIPGIFKAVANAAKVFVWFTNAFFYFNAQYPALFRLGEQWALNIGPALLSAFLLQASVYWFLFDLLVNLIGGRPLLHLGKTALLDKAFSSYEAKLAVQVVAIVVCIFLTVWANSMIP